MIRRLTAAVLVVLVQCGALSAPLLHVHLDDRETGHHHGQALHAHLDAHHEEIEFQFPGPVFDHPDDAGRTVEAALFVAAAIDTFAIPVVAPPSFTLVVAAARLIRRTDQISHAHDPPSLASLPSRAPPFLLS